MLVLQWSDLNSWCKVSLFFVTLVSRRAAGLVNDPADDMPLDITMTPRAPPSPTGRFPFQARMIQIFCVSTSSAIHLKPADVPEAGSRVLHGGMDVYYRLPENCMVFCVVGMHGWRSSDLLFTGCLSSGSEAFVRTNVKLQTKHHRSLRL